MNIAVIPARGGSKRIPRKNVKPFAGKPMIAHAIEAATCCEVLGRVVVSTDDDEIAKVARKYGAEVPFLRPAELADDHTPTVPVIAHAIEALAAMGERPDRVCCLYPCAPFIRQNELTSALDLLEAHDGNGYVFPIAAYPAPIQRALRLGHDGAVKPIAAEYALKRTQDLEPAYFDTGQFYWATAETWVRGEAIHGDALGLVIPESRAVDIDTPEDWERAERLYTAMEAEGSAR